jgi:2-succinyl-6-hydroxy-2,4-cyclohexadiene-1-carboxylate synthase
VIHGFLGGPSSLDPVVARVESLCATVERETLPGHAGAAFDRSWGWDEALARMSHGLLEDGGTILLGYSMGARVGLSLLLARPRAFAGAVLVGVDAGIDDPGARAERRVWERAMAARIADEGLARFVDHWETLPVFATQRALSEELRRAVRARRIAHDPNGVGWAVEALGTGSMPSMWDRLTELSVPVRVVTGARDEKFSAIGARMAQRCGRMAHETVDGVGHDVGLEAPEALAVAVARALEEVKAP